MFPVYFIVGLLNIFAQRNNYGIKDQPNGIDIRVRRSLPDTGFEPITHTEYENQLLERPKRYAYYRKIKIPLNTQHTENTTNRYDIFNPNYNYLFNKTNITGFNNRPFIRSYPYGYPPGYEPRTATPGYRNPGSTPIYYNYQNPNGQSFAGYNSYTPKPINYSPLTDMLANYPKNNDQNPLNNFRGSSGFNNNNNLPTSANNIYNIPTTTPYMPVNNYPYGTPPNNNNLPTTFNTNNPYGTPPNSNLPSSVNNNNPYGMPSSNNNLPTPVNNMPTVASTTPNPTFNVITPTQNVTSTTTEKILSSCVICNIRCPKFMQRLGAFCVPEDY